MKYADIESKIKKEKLPLSGENLKAIKTVTEWAEELDKEIQKYNERYNSEEKEEILKQRLDEEIENKAKAEEILDETLMNTLIGLIVGAFVSENHNLEEDALKTNEQFVRGAKSLKYETPYEITHDCVIDLQKFDEFGDFVYKYYDVKLFRESFHNWSTIQANAKVYKLLLSGIYIELNLKIPLSDAMKWFDYSVIILDYLKATEKFLVHKLNKEKLLSDKENRHIYMSKIIEKVKKNKDKLFKKGVPLFAEEKYFKILDDFGNVYRNGYVHREYLSYERALFIKEMIFNILILTEIIFK